jgi:hypothetical protein
MQRQDQPSGTFPNASAVLIRDSILNDISGDSHNHYSSDLNTVNDSHVNVARDLIVFVNSRLSLPIPSQQEPDIPKPPDRYAFPWPSVLWRFQALFSGTAVTLDTPASTATDLLSNPQATASISPDPTDTQPFLIRQAAAPEARPSQASGCEPYPSESESEDNSPQPDDTGSNVVSICTNTFLHGP